MEPELTNPILDVPPAQNDPMEKANLNIRPTFRAAIHERELNLYTMVIEEPGHFLECKLTLEFQDAAEQGKPSYGPLVIFPDDAQTANLKIYKEFLAHYGQATASEREKTEMIIPADRKAFDAWVEFMKQTAIRFQQVLWRKRKINPEIQDYLQYLD